MGPSPSMGKLNPTGMNIHFSLEFSNHILQGNLVKLLYAPKEIIEITRKILSKHFKLMLDSIHNQRPPNDPLTIIQLDLIPLSYTFDEDVLKVKIFQCDLIKAYYQLGWQCKNMSLDLSLDKDNDAHAIYFEKISPHRSIQTEIVCLDLNESDKIRVLGTCDVEADIVKNVRQAIQSAWQQGIQEEKTKLEKFFQFKLKGNPWTTGFDENERLASSRLLMELISKLYFMGWSFVTAINRKKHEKDINGLFFRQIPNSPKSAVFKYGFIGSNMSDTIHLHNIPKELIAIIRSEVVKFWPNGIQSEDDKERENVYRFKFKGNPFECSSKTVTSGTQLINGVFCALKNKGWSLDCHVMLSKSWFSAGSVYFFRFDPSTPINSIRKPYICIGFHGSNVVRIINGNQNIIDQVRSSVELGWTGGNTKEKDANGAYNFELKFDPFKCINARALNHLSANSMIVHILDNMHMMNYKLVAITCLHSKFSGIGTLFFSE